MWTLAILHLLTLLKPNLAPAVRVRPPLVAMGCELMLQSTLTDLAERGRAPDLVRRLVARRPPSDRLAELSAALTESNPDLQIVALEWRGPKLTEVTTRLAAELEQTWQRYDDQRRHLGQSPRRLMQMGTLLFGARFVEFHFALATQLLESGLATLSPSRAFALVLLPFVGTTVSTAVMFRWRQYDRHLLPTLRGATELAASAPDYLAHAMNDAELPRQANEMFLARTRPDWHCRRRVLAECLPTLAEWFARGLKLNSDWFSNEVTSAGEPSRFIRTDHLLFWDRGEPVWLFVYRAYRRRPPNGRTKSDAIDQPVPSPSFNYSQSSFVDARLGIGTPSAFAKNSTGFLSFSYRRR